ncbi:MAG: DHHW family protein [Oscillospiraceae bacterium]|jgi:hypothetical protein
MTKHSSNKIQIIVFFGFFVLGLALLMILPGKSFSERENRELQQLPKFSFSSFFGGKYTSKFETFVADQFPMRDAWTTLKARCELASGKKQNKDVYLCSGDRLLEKYAAPDQQQLDTNIAAVNSFAQNSAVPVYFALVPGSTEIYSDLLPKNAPTASEKAVIDYCYARSGAKNIDMETPLQAHKDEYIFYRTDHHWTTLGAYYGYETLLTAMGQVPAPLSAFPSETVSQDFYGTVYSKSGISWVRPDEIDIRAQQQPDTKIINYISGQAAETPMYDRSYLEKKDKYAMFMGGNTPLEIVSTGKTDGKKLLVLRDSYFDSITPYLQNDFSQIHIMDLRYYKTQAMEQSISEYIAQYGIDEVLICYSVSTFGTDTNVFLLQ